MKSWTLSNYLKERLWVQYILTFVPILFILVYLGFFIYDFINIVGVIAYNDDVVRVTDEQFIQPVELVPVGSKYYVHFKDIELPGEVTVKAGDKILDLVLNDENIYEVHFSNGVITALDGIDASNEFTFNADDDILLSIYLSEDGTYKIKYPDDTEEDVNSISFLQYEQDGEEYKFTLQYTRVYDKSNLSEMIVTALPEIGYYFDIGHETLLHNDGKGAMSIFLNSSNLLSVIIVVIVYTLLLIFMSRDKDLKILHRKSIWIFYIVMSCILCSIFIVAKIMY